MTIKSLVYLSCATVAFTLPLRADLVFDNADAPLTTTHRDNSYEGVGAYLQIGSQNVTINQIAVNAEPRETGQLKFVIFSDSAPPGSATGSLLLSDTVNVTSASSLSYIASDPISFTLLAGQYYDIGAIFSGTNIDYTYDFTPDTENGITSIASSQNFDDFTDPVQVGHGGTSDISIRLYGPSPVPEPATWLLALAGFAAYFGITHKRISLTKATFSPVPTPNR